MKPFDLASRLAVMVLIAAIGIGCQKNGPVETADVVKGQAPQFIKLPQNPEGNTLNKIISASQLITAKDGGEVILDYKYAAGTFGEVAIKATLKFLPGSVSKDLQVTLSVDDEVLLTRVDLSFDPHGAYFLKPAILDVEAKGVDLSGVSAERLKVYYENQVTNQWDVIPTKEIIVKTHEGYVKCIEASLEHFSRYAFGY